MTKLLLRLFVKDYENPQDTAVRAGAGRLSGLVGIVCNLLLCAMKLIAGSLIGSVSITADALNNLSDAASSIVTFAGFKLAEKPADAHHPYGHARYEYVSALAVAAIILVIGFELAKSSVQKIFAPTEVAFTIPVGIILLVSIAIKLWLYLFNRRLGKLIGSNALLATAADSRNDMIATGAVLAAGIVEAVSGWQVDGIMGLGVAVFILYSGCRLARETISPLLGEGASPELRQRIRELVEKEPLVLGYHDLMVHDYGPGQRFASLHVEMDREEDPLVCHEIIDKLERRCLRKYNVHLVIHYDPVITDNAAQDEMRGFITDILQAQDQRLTLHDFRMFQGRKHTNLMFDVTLPHDIAQKEPQLQRIVQQALEDRAPGAYHAVITFDRETVQG